MREPALLLQFEERQQPDRPAFVDERDVEAAGLLVLDHPPAVALVELGVRDALLHDPAAEQRLPVGRVVLERVPPPDVARVLGARDPCLVRPDGDRLGAGVVRVDGALVGVERLSRRPRDDVEELVQPRGRRHGAAGGQQRLQPAVLLGLPAQEARVLDGRARGHRQQLQQAEVVGAEAPPGALLDEHDRAHNGVLEDQRQAEHALLAPPLHGAARTFTQGGIVGLVLHRGAALEQVAEPRQAGDREDVAEPGPVVLADLAGPERDGRELVRLRTVLVEVALPHVERLGRALRDGREHLLLAGASGDRQTHVGRDRQRIARTRHVAHRHIPPPPRRGSR